MTISAGPSAQKFDEKASQLLIRAARIITRKSPKARREIQGEAAATKRGANQVRTMPSPTGTDVSTKTWAPSAVTLIAGASAPRK